LEFKNLYLSANSWREKMRWWVPFTLC
jgi:hypothetical protein